MQQRLVWLFMIVHFAPDSVQCGKILILCPMCSKSHKNFMEPIAFALAERNHSVTVVSSHKTISHPNIRDIQVQEDFDMFSSFSALEIRKTGVLTLVQNQTFLPTILEGCRTTYENREFLKLLNDTWDVVMIDGFANECLYGFMYKLGAPWIISMPLPTPLFLASMMGLRLPTSFVPESVLPFTHQMNLLERIVNYIAPKFMEYFFSKWFLAHEAIYREYFKGEDIPTIAEFRITASLMLVNSHFSLNYPRPTMPDTVEVGGVQCRAGKPLPKDLEEFISGAKDGVILFSLGSIVRGQNMPEETRKVLVKAFAGMKQRVIWKWDHLPMDDLSSNVKLYKWLPLQDVLAHPNVQLFITHGGLLSTQEAICHGVPMVGLPVFADQDLNIKRYVDLKIALGLEITTLASEELLTTVNKAIEEPKFRENVQHLSSLYRDRPVSALDQAVFWVEYVMRYKGAPHLRSPARTMTDIQYHSIDVIAILISIVVALVALGGYLCLILYLKVSLYWFPQRKTKLA